MKMELWELMEALGLIITFETKIKELAQSGWKTWKVHELNGLNADIDFSTLSPDLVYCGDKAESYIAKMKEKVLGGSLFSPKEKEAFIDNFFSRNMDILPYKKDIASVLNDFLNRLEKSLLKQMSPGEIAIYKRLGDISEKATNQVNNRGDLETVHRSHTANALYTDSFMKSLFLHPNDHRVTLANLFVMQDYREFCQNKEIKKEDLPDLPTRIANFIHQSTRPFLFIEGDAGSGKSTLIGWINHHSNLQDDIAKSLLDGKSLVTIRLRDLDKRTISNEGSLIPAILSYMRLCTVDNLEDEFPEAVVILDGFDELCMIDQITNYEELLYDLSSKRLNNYKFIITTRPKYIRLGKINIPHEYISLRHFDKGKRNEWLEKYSNPSFCNQSIAPEVRKFIEQIDDDNVSAICDTPMSLYMLAAKKIEIDSELNIWELYHQIFFEEISITQYNEMFPDPNRNYAHRIVKHRDILYQISEEIAYRMYSTGNSKLFLSSEELFEIICELNQRNGNFLDPPRVEMKLLAERCYALCNYWKADSSDGMVEFYHNNIRDFFLCEKIYREMNSIYNRFKTDSQYNSREAATTLCELFHFDILETTVNKFLLLRAKSDLKCGNQEFPSHEVIQEHLPEIFELMLTDGTIFDVKKSKNPIQFILNVLTCTAQIYRHVYEPFLWDNRLIKWWNSVSEVNKNGMIPQVFRAVFCQVPTALDSNSMLLLDSESMLTMASNGDFCGIDLQSCDLRNISFQSSKICNANFENTILCGCDFSDSILSDSNFTNADMQYVKLLGADMRRCILSGANLRGTDLPDGACGIGQDTQ